jgi:hypothetical protein
MFPSYSFLPLPFYLTPLMQGQQAEEVDTHVVVAIPFAGRAFAL